MRRGLLTAAVLAAAIAAVAGGVAVLDRAAGRRLSARGLRIVCAGDSITAASYPKHLESILRRQGLECSVVNRGRPGNTSGEYLAYLVPSRMVSREDPDIVLLQLGTNDVRIDRDRTKLKDFVDHMERIIAIITAYRNGRGESPRILLGLIPEIVTPEGLFDLGSRRRVTEEINPALRDLASRHGLTVVDNYELFRQRPELLPEIHPSEEGYRALAENWAEALMAELGK